MITKLEVNPRSDSIGVVVHTKDMTSFRMCIDDEEIAKTNGVVGIAHSHRHTGLLPDTRYTVDVEVQTADGITDWVTMQVFTSRVAT